jgi:hybrid cluster-associated redox disulfide protein
MTEKISSGTTVEELLERYPGTIKIFMDFGIPCFVCGEPLWGTIEETAVNYGVDLSLLLERLSEGIAKDA